MPAQETRLAGDAERRVRRLVAERRRWRGVLSDVACGLGSVDAELEAVLGDLRGPVRIGGGTEGTAAVNDVGAIVDEGTRHWWDDALQAKVRYRFLDERGRGVWMEGRERG